MSAVRLLLDTSSLIALARLGALELVSGSVGELRVTAEVLAEALEGDRPGADTVAEAVRQGIVRVVGSPDTAPLPGLGAGETSTIRGAQVDEVVAVIDDRAARRTASRLGVTLTGTVAILVRLDETGGPPIAESLAELDRIGFRASPAIRAWALDRRRMGPVTDRPRRRRS